MRDFLFTALFTDHKFRQRLNLSGKPYAFSAGGRFTFWQWCHNFYYSKTI